MYYYSQTDYDIEMAGRKAREKARKDFEEGVYDNPYEETNVVYFDYESEWKHLNKMQKSA